MKYYGRDINIVEAFGHFKRIHVNLTFKSEGKNFDFKPDKRTEVSKDDLTLKKWFLIALYDLKHMGIISSTK